LRYTVSADPFLVAEAYESIHEILGDAMFGIHADARLVSLLSEMGALRHGPVLDVGAGTGRNAIFLARRGCKVDAVELVPRFARLLEDAAAMQHLPIRVLTGDIFALQMDLCRNYRLVLLSGTVGDLRGLSDLRRMLELATDILVVGGMLILNLHIALDGYSPPPLAQQWAEQCCATCFTTSELSQAVAGLPLVLRSNDSTHDYEQSHLAEVAWPPTPVFTEWALGQHMYDVPPEFCPIELRWLVFEKVDLPG
jgi:SAM-dependent methyltransferase